MSEAATLTSIPTAQRVLSERRAVASALNIPGYWLLDSPGLSRVLASARRLAGVPGAPILIQAERGSGATELARLVHDTGPETSKRPFRAVPSYAINESEVARWSSCGTLFIDDIETLRPTVQAWLYELVTRRPPTGPRVRIIVGSRLAATELFELQHLNQELMLALDVGRLVIAPLRQRVGDIMFLARRFLDHYGRNLRRPQLRLSFDAESKLIKHSYPANVRELRNVIERALALEPSDEIGPEAVVFHHENVETSARYLRRPPPIANENPDRATRFPTLSELERDYLITLIRELGGKRTEISRVMGISYPTVLKKISQYRLDVNAILHPPNS